MKSSSLSISFHHSPCFLTRSAAAVPMFLQPSSMPKRVPPSIVTVHNVKSRKTSDQDLVKLEYEKKKKKKKSQMVSMADLLDGEKEDKCEEMKLVQVLEGLEEEAIMGNDEGREPTDYHRRAHLFDACSRVFQGLKDN